jgi:hypothetical protein
MFTSRSKANYKSTQIDDQSRQSFQWELMARVPKENRLIGKIGLIAHGDEIIAWHDGQQD